MRTISILNFKGGTGKCSIAQNLGNALVTPQVHTDTGVPYAQSKNMTIFEYEQTTKRKSRAAEDFKQLASHLLGAEVTV